MAYPLTALFLFQTEEDRDFAQKTLQNQVAMFLRKDISRWQEIIEEVEPPVCSRCGKYFPESERKTDENGDVYCPDCESDEDLAYMDESRAAERKMEYRMEKLG